MPPLRTMPPAKPVKTERTHAENQERAYIAASRRSDRSLEARVESARRASEIHKKRTGRSLRVTEADVINEEMYEEEDDDLPAQIRRITAHLHTGNDPFNRRLQAYVANHIAMRSALGQVVADNWQQQQNMNYNSAPQQNFAFQTPMLPPQMPARSPQMYRSAPYPVPSPRAEPLMSPPQTSSSHSSPVEVKQRPGPLNLTDPIFSNPFGTNVAPLTATLPLESQQLLAGAPIDLNDPSMAAMMQTHLVPTPGGNFAPAPGFYSYNPNGKKKSVSPKSEKPTKNMGMNATLAPSMLDVVAPPTFPENDLFSPHTPAGFGFGFEYGNDFVPHDEPLSGQLTPGETDWNTWIEPQALGEEVTSQ